MRSLILSVIAVASCSRTVAQQQPRAWYGGASPEPTCGWSDGYGSKWECDGPVTMPAPTLVYAVGTTIEVGEEWQAYCRRKHWRSRSWMVEPCDFVDHQAEVVCDKPGCIAGRSNDGRLTITLSAPARYSVRVRFRSIQQQTELELPPIEAVEPDVVAVGCTAGAATMSVRVSVGRRADRVTATPTVRLASGAVCKALGTDINQLSVFECPADVRFDGTVATPTLSKAFAVECAAG